MSALSVSILTGISNALFDIKMAPAMAKSKYVSKRALNDPEFVKKYSAKVKDREEKRAMKRAMKEGGCEANTQNIDNAIVASEDDILAKANMIGNSIRTQKLIQFAYYYMTNKNAALMNEFSTEERQIINAVAAMFYFGKIYTDSGIANLKMYDPTTEEYLEGGKFFLCIKDIEYKKNDDAFLEKVETRKAALAAMNPFVAEDLDTGKTVIAEEVPETGTVGSKWTKDENGIIHPIFINENGVVLDEEEEVKQPEPEHKEYQSPVIFATKELWDQNTFPDDWSNILDESTCNILEKSIGKLAPEAHCFRKIPNSDLLALYILDKNEQGVPITKMFYIDLGTVMGGTEPRIYTKMDVGNGSVDTIFVSAKHEDIVKKVLDSQQGENFYADYVLTKDEAQEVLLDYFRNMEIYKYVDMSDTEFIAEMNVDDFQKLGKKLTFILTKVQEQSTGVGLPRFRFNYWNGIDDFIIVSDNAVKSPLSISGKTSSIILEGLIYEVKGDDVIQTYGPTRLSFHIDEYGEM